ncbi:unnamed protein product [Meganyctiphanes norvegica]|uniref:CS domain-containing protein n=1 Tax=Meganyctiphanes norvegica TaxID=48144 RepID=A0AAV2Q144_MEGNR
MSEKEASETDIEAYLEKVYHMNDGPNKISSFLNNVFEYLYKKNPEELYGTNHIDGQHLVSQSFCKWRHKYRNEKSQASPKSQSSIDNNIPTNQELSHHIPPMAISEVEVETIQEEIFDSCSGEIKDSAKPKNQASSRSDNNVEKKSAAYFDSSNGADRGSYAWTQTIDDIEVRIPVPKKVERGKQVKVLIKSSSLEVRIMEGASDWVTHITGNLHYPIKVEESLWSLSPKQHILINLEKCEERWWNKLLESEQEINLNNINAERDYGTLPEEDRSKIQELIWNKHQKDQGKPTSEDLKMQSVLRGAWNAEGSPFKGQPYDPSLVNFAPGGSYSS